MKKGSREPAPGEPVEGEPADRGQGSAEPRQARAEPGPAGSARPGSSPSELESPAGAEPPFDAFATGTMNAERLAPPAEVDYKDRWLRAEAEIQNTRRRAQRDREDAVRESEERILLDMVEVLDDLERALEALKDEQAQAAWAQGVALTAQRLRDALARRGVTAIPTLGQPFDPAFHEALLEIPAPEGVLPGAVAQEVRRGYARGNRALRAARVVVARAEG